MSPVSYTHLFGDFISLYVKDMEHRLKPSTVASKKWLIDLKVTPFFKKIPLNEIKPTHVRQWQNSLTSYRDENSKPYAQTYLKCINNQLTAIFNYAVKYLSLIHISLFRRLACRPAAFCAVWDGQAKGETPLANHKLHAARFRVCVGLAALAGVSCGIGGQPVDVYKRQPRVNPSKKLVIRKIRGPDELTAASASSPRKRPTIRESAVL